MIRRRLKPGDWVETATVPGWTSRVKIEQVIELRGKEHFIVTIRETPDCVFAIRDRGQLYDCNDGRDIPSSGRIV